jgi:NAD(P)-dependent dehydrogenase (short-subunit alcohol dehydrogenase family)
MIQRTWLITGVNSGFGRHMTEQLLNRGDRVAGTVRKMDSMNDLKAKHGDRLWLASLDVTDMPAIKRGTDKAFAEFDKIDVVVSNAGYGLFGAAESSRTNRSTSRSHQPSRPYPGGSRGRSPPAQARRRQNSSTLHLWRPGRPSGRVPLSRQQVGNRRLFRVDDAGTCALQDRRHDH